jgi:phage shock protein A
MTDISKEAVERLARTADLFAKAMKAWQHQTQKHNEDVRDTLRALSTRVQELEELLDQMNKAAKEAEAAERWCGRLQGLDEAVDEMQRVSNAYAAEGDMKSATAVHDAALCVEALKTKGEKR